MKTKRTTTDVTLPLEDRRGQEGARQESHCFLFLFIQEYSLVAVQQNAVLVYNHSQKGEPKSSPLLVQGRCLTSSTSAEIFFFFWFVETIGLKSPPWCSLSLTLFSLSRWCVPEQTKTSPPPALWRGEGRSQSYLTCAGSNPSASHTKAALHPLPPPTLLPSASS